MGKVERTPRSTGRGRGSEDPLQTEEEIKGLEVLYAGDLSVIDVAQQGGAWRVLVVREETKEETEAPG